MKPQQRTRLILESHLDQQSRSVAIAVADHVNGKTGLAWPGLELLARETGLGVRTVRRVFSWAVKSGWIVVESGGGGVVRRVRFDWQRLQECDGKRTSGARHQKRIPVPVTVVESEDPGPRDRGTPVPVTGPPRSPGPYTPVPVTHEPVRNREEEPVTEPVRTPPAGAVGPSQAPPIKPPRVKKPATSKTLPGYHEAIAVWDAEHLSAFEHAYAWRFRGERADGGLVKVWLASARVTVEDPAGGLSRLTVAVRAYFAAVKAGTTWPKDEPASTRRFTLDVSRWLMTDPAKTTTKPRTEVEKWGDALDLLNGGARGD